MADYVYLSIWLDDFSEENMLRAWATALAQFPTSPLASGIRELIVHPLNWSEAPVFEQSFPDGAPVEEVVAAAAEFLHEDYAYEASLNWDVWVSQSPDTLTQWERVPQTVSVSCLGPQFETDDPEERSHLLLNLGLDTLFLPDASLDDLDDDLSNPLLDPELDVDEPEEIESPFASSRRAAGPDDGTTDEEESAELGMEELDDVSAGNGTGGVAETCFRDNIAQLLEYVYRLEKSMPISHRLLWSGSGEDLAERIRAIWG